MHLLTTAPQLKFFSSCSKLFLFVIKYFDRAFGIRSIHYWWVQFFALLFSLSSIFLAIQKTRFVSVSWSKVSTKKYCYINGHLITEFFPQLSKSKLKMQNSGFIEEFRMAIWCRLSNKFLKYLIWMGVVALFITILFWKVPTL